MPAVVPIQAKKITKEQFGHICDIFYDAHGLSHLTGGAARGTKKSLSVLKEHGLGKLVIDGKLKYDLGIGILFRAKKVEDGTEFDGYNGASNVIESDARFKKSVDDYLNNPESKISP